MYRITRAYAIILAATMAVSTALAGYHPPAHAQSSHATVSIILWHQEQPPERVKRIQQMIDAFNASHPGMHISQQVQSWGNIYQKAVSAVQSGNQPEILFTIPDFTTVVKATGAVQPVDGVIAAMDKAHHFLKAALLPYHYDGHYWAVPLYGMVQSLWYRKDLFRKAHIAHAPATWDELLAAAKALTHGRQYGIGLPASKSLYTDQTIYDFMVTARAQDLFAKNGSLRFDNPATVRAYSFYNTLWRSSPPGSTSWIWGDAEAAFDAGTVAMIIQFTTIAGYDKQSGHSPADLGVAPIPVPSGGQHGSIFYSNAAMILTKDPAKQRVARTFLEWLLQPPQYGRFLNMEPCLFLPETEDGSKAASFWNDPLAIKYRSQLRQMVAETKHGYLFGFTEGTVNPNIGKISGQNMLAQTVQAMIVSKKSPAAAVRAGQQAMAAAIH